MRLKSVLIAVAGAGLALGGCTTAPQENNLAGDFLSGRFAERRNSIDDAAAAYAKAREHAPQEVPILRDAFFYHLAGGDIDAAANYAREIIAIGKDADDGLASLTLAAQAIKAGRYKPARAILVGNVSSPLLKSVAFLTDVWIEEGISGPSGALDRIASPGSDVFTGFNALHKGLLYEATGEMDKARGAFEASAFGVGDPIGRDALGAFLERAGETEDARQYYALLGAEPGPMRREAEMGLARLDKGRASKEYLNTTPAEGAAYAFYAFAGAVIQQAAGERARAEEAGFRVGDPRYNYPLALARIALYLNPDLAEARRLIGTILNIYEEYDAASEVLAAIPPSSPHFEQARIEMAGMLLVQDKAKEAIRILKDALRRDVDSDGQELHWSLANIYANEGDHEEAVKALNAIIASVEKASDETPPEKAAWRFYVSRGASLIELGRWDDAEKDLQRAVEIAPEEPAALNYLGYSWAERGVNLDEAFKLIEKAVELEPDSGAIIDSLGWAHYQRGEYEKAAPYLEQAAALEPSDPTITDHLGDVYWRLGRKIEAGYQWRRSLELEPNEKLEKSLHEKLEKGLPEVESAAPEKQ